MEACICCARGCSDVNGPRIKRLVAVGTIDERLAALRSVERMRMAATATAAVSESAASDTADTADSFTSLDHGPTQAARCAQQVAPEPHPYAQIAAAVCAEVRECCALGACP